MRNDWREPLDEADWHCIKAATCDRKYLERVAEADEATADDWLVAVERDDQTDPYEQQTAGNSRKCP